MLRRRTTGEIEKAWIGELSSGKTAPLQYELVDEEGLFREWTQDIATQPQMPAADAEQLVDSLWIGGVLAEVLRKTPLMPGQTRLIGFTDDRPGRLEVNPAEDQFDGRCVVVAHLTPQQLDEVTPDINIMSRPNKDIISPLEPVPPPTEAD